MLVGRKRRAEANEGWFLRIGNRLLGVEFSREFVGKVPPCYSKGASKRCNSLENLSVIRRCTVLLNRPSFGCVIGGELSFKPSVRAVANTPPPAPPLIGVGGTPESTCSCGSQHPAPSPAPNRGGGNAGEHLFVR